MTAFVRDIIPGAHPGGAQNRIRLLQRRLRHLRFDAEDLPALIRKRRDILHEILRLRTKGSVSADALGWENIAAELNLESRLASVHVDLGHSLCSRLCAPEIGGERKRILSRALRRHFPDLHAELSPATTRLSRELSCLRLRALEKGLVTRHPLYRGSRKIPKGAPVEISDQGRFHARLSDGACIDVAPRMVRYRRKGDT